MLISKYSGKPIKHFLGSMTTTDNVTFEFIETEDSVELYVADKMTFDCMNEGVFIGSFDKKNAYTCFEIKARLLRDNWNSLLINEKCHRVLKEYYNDYYRYDEFFEEIK